MPRTTAEKLAIFRACFSGRQDVFGTYAPRTGRVRQVKAQVSDQVILQHLKGIHPYGVYLLDGERTGAAVADFDEDGVLKPRHLYLHARHHELASYVERSKRKGWHVWFFFPAGGMPARKARLVLRFLLEEIDCPGVEVFPKQDRLSGDTSYGNFINAPLFGALVPQHRTVFVDPEDNFRPYANQWDLLAGVQRIPEDRLDALIEINGLESQPPSVESQPDPQPPGERPVPRRFGVPPCAQRILAEGVKANQRVTCFRLSIHLKHAGIPEDLAIALLKAWSQKNRPEGQRIITDAEIRMQAHDAYQKDYRSYGCDDEMIRAYCDPCCPVILRPHAPVPGKSRPPPGPAANSQEPV